MVVDAGYKKPSNRILVAGEPLVQHLKIENATNMYPGRLVMQGTLDDEVLVADAFAVNSMAVGFLGYEQTQKGDRPADVDTLYTINKQAAVLNGGGFVIVAALQASQGTLKKGDALVMGTAGCLAKAAVSTVVASGAAHVTDAQVNTGTFGSAGPVVAYAEETIADIAEIADIMVRSII
jgi:hypothetical protein